MKENLVTSQKYRVAKDVTKDEWDVLSFQTMASDVKFQDGETGENKSNQLNQVSSKLDKVSDKLNTLTTDVLEIKKVKTLPLDAAKHPNTLYLVTE